MDLSESKLPLIDAIVEWKMKLFSNYHLLHRKQGDDLKALCDKKEAELRRELENDPVEALERKLQTCKNEQMFLAL